MITDYKTVLIKVITLLWREKLLINGTNSKEIAKSALSYIKTQENVLGSQGFDIIGKLKEECEKLINDNSNTEADAEDFLQTLRVICDQDTAAYEALEQSIKTELSEQALKKSVYNLSSYVKNITRAHQMSDLIRTTNKDFNYSNKVSDISTFARGLIEKLEPFSVHGNDTDKAVISELDLSDTDKVNDTFIKAQARENGVAGFKTGWQDFNTALKGSLRRGYMYMVTALQHNHKTGFCISTFIDVLKYNTPQLIDSTKRPLALYISGEDETEDNIAYMFKRIKEIETKTEIDVSKEDTSSMTRYIQEVLSKTGFCIKLVRINPSEWTYVDFQNYILQLEAEGYEVQLCFIDYLNLLSKAGCTQGSTGDDVRDLFRRMRNFFSVRGTTCITPHQLSTEAKQLVREGRQDLVKQVSQKGYTDGCKRIDQDIDGEISLHIERMGDKAFLTVMVGKHRKVFVEESKRYFVIPFMPYGPLPDDLNGKKITSRKLGEMPGDENTNTEHYNAF